MFFTILKSSRKETSVQIVMSSSSVSLFFCILLVQIPVLMAAGNDTDHLALLDIKSKIIYDPQGVMNSWNESVHFCQWIGVTCGLLHKRVTTIHLPFRGLVGTLSPHVGNLSFLRAIELRNNTFGGRIPPEVGRLFRLERLSLGNNSFEGEIPANLSRCTKLNTLQLSYNKLVGKLPIELSSLPVLEMLSIHYNNLTGGIPPFIGNITSLKNISLANCRLGGSIPNVFHNLRSLVFLGFSGNDLIGTIPSSLYNLSSLVVFSVAVNHLSGSLPTNFGLNLPHLHILQLSYNNFSGSLPLSISNCSKLETIEIGVNYFEGKVGVNFENLRNLRALFLGSNRLGSGDHDEMKFIDSLSNCSYLKWMDLVDNKFEGTLPNSLGNLSAKLSYLALDQNSFYGSLPSSIGNLFGLTSMTLTRNHFTGNIPTTIGNLQNLRRLTLTRNNFSGTIPDSIGNLSMVYYLSFGENMLEGSLPLSVGECHNLNFFSVDDNNLSGHIPKQVFELPSLSIGLELGRNHFSGPLPIEVGRLLNLEQLYVDGNNLSGELPSSLGSCTRLELLNMGHNFFQGSIPPSLSSLRALREFNLTNNNFTGRIPRFLEELPLENLDLSFNNFEGDVPIKGVFANSSALVVGNHRLCGGMTKLQLPKCSFRNSEKQKKLSRSIIIVISTLSTLAIVSTVSFFLYCCLIKKIKDDEHSGIISKQPFLKVSYDTLLKATDGFSSEKLIGVGAFSSVYKGIFDEDGKIVAVKVLNLQLRGSFKSFIRECEALREVRHRNLVKIITCCSSIDSQGNDFKALVYQFMPNGSLESWLHLTPSTLNELPQLSLVQRISISIDVAFALDYLHHNSENPIIHCDLKPSNILLDGDMVAHVGDFGLAKFLLPELSSADASNTSGLRGTIGYAPPEYGVGNEVSTNGDVYSYGILLLEMIIGKKPTDPLFQQGLNIHNYARTAMTNHALLDIVEPMLLNEEDEECLISMLKIAVACSMDSPQDRMDISEVIRQLHLLKGARL